MYQLVTIAAAAVAFASPDANDFVLHETAPAQGAKSSKPAGSKIESTKYDAAVRFYVIQKDKGPIKGIVICMTSPTESKYCTEETNGEGYAEVLVPVGAKYDVTYLSLGRKDVTATVTVTNEPKQNIKLTLRYTPRPPAPPFVLTGVVFDTGSWTLRSDAAAKLDIVVEFMRLKKSARLEISGHTDNVGKAKANKTLSEKRAQSCRTYLISKGIAGDRIKAAGYGGERPIAPNDTDEGRQKNRRIEVIEIPAN